MREKKERARWKRRGRGWVGGEESREAGGECRGVVRSKGWARRVAVELEGAGKVEEARERSD